MNYNLDLTLEILHTLKKYGLDISNYKISNNNVQIRCPFASISGHTDYFDSKPSFGVKITESGFVYNCFACKRSGKSLIDFINNLIEHNLIDKNVNPFELQNLINLKVFKNLNTAKNKKLNEEQQIKPLIGEPDYSNIKFIEYNLKRGVNTSTLKSLGIRYYEKTNSVIFPVYNFYGKYVGYIKHNIDSQPKYDNQLNKRSILFLENRIIRKETKGIIVEGVYDAIITYQHLVDLKLNYEYSVVATLGSGVTSEQIMLIDDYFSSLILYGDNDEAGIKMEQFIYRYFKNRKPLIWKMRYEGKDPATVSKESFLQNLKRVRPFGIYF